MFYEHIIIVPNSGFNYDISIHAQHSLPGTACLSSLSLPPLFRKPFISSSLDPPLTTPADAKFVDLLKINLDIFAIYEVEPFLILKWLSVSLKFLPLSL